MTWAFLTALVIDVMAKSFGASGRVMTQAVFVARKPVYTASRGW
jgi:hypothetical protein